MNNEYKKALDMLGDVRAFLVYDELTYHPIYDLELIRDSLIQEFHLTRKEIYSLTPQDYEDKISALSSESPINQIRRVRGMDPDEKDGLPPEVIESTYEFDNFKEAAQSEILEDYEGRDLALISMLINDIKNGRTFDKGNEEEIGKTIYEITKAMYDERRKKDE